MEITKAEASTKLQELKQQEQELLKIINKPEPSLLDQLPDYPSACKMLGKKEKAIADFMHIDDEDRDSDFAYHQLCYMYRALNNHRKPDYTNGDEKKWFPIFAWNEKASGFVFSFSDCGLWAARTIVGPRLCVFDEKTSTAAAKQWQSYWNRYHKY